MNEITFYRTSNIFINGGIVGLYIYLQKNQTDDLPDFKFDWTPDGKGLTIICDSLFSLLESIYYQMGKDLYDTSGKNARKKADKFFFIKTPFSFNPFYKMKTYGIAGLITNDPQPSPRIKYNAIVFKKLIKEDPGFAKDIATVYEEKGLKLKGFEIKNGEIIQNPKVKGDSKIFLNEPYIKITRLDPIKKEYFQSGDQVCYLTNQSFKKLVDVQNTSPFIKGLKNFDSHFSPTSQKISWQAMFLSRFAPKIGFYAYVSGLDSLVGYFFESDSLKNLYQLYKQHEELYKDRLQLIECNYMNNFKVYSFFEAKKGQEKTEEPKDYANRAEIQFMLIYTVYSKLLKDRSIQSMNEIESIFDLGIDEIPITLMSFQADKFSGTLRPNKFEYFNNFKFAISTIIHLEKNGVLFDQILQSLKFLKNSERNSGGKFVLQRRTRGTILYQIMHGKSILTELAQLFYLCYTYLISKDSIGYKNFKQLARLLQFYEPIINRKMNKELQEKAFNLGTSIGRAIIDHDYPKDQKQKKENAKYGRKYIIDLQKSRNLNQFNDAIIRLQNRYHLSVKTELFKVDLDEKNVNLVKQFALIGALNQLNTVLNNDFNEKNDKKV